MSIFSSLQRFYTQVLPFDANTRPDVGLINSNFSSPAPATLLDARFAFSNVPLVLPDDFNNKFSTTSREPPNTPTSSESEYTSDESEYAQSLSPAVEAVAPERACNGDAEPLPTSTSTLFSILSAFSAFEDDVESSWQGLENTFDDDEEDDSMLFASDCNGKWHSGLRPPLGPNKVLSVQHLGRPRNTELNNTESVRRPDVNRRPLTRTETYLDVIDIDEEADLVMQSAAPPTDQLPVAESETHTLPTPPQSPKRKSPTSSEDIETSPPKRACLSIAVEEKSTRKRRSLPRGSDTARSLRSTTSKAPSQTTRAAYVSSL